MSAERDEQHMARALALATRAAGRTNPNPLVGCVIVRRGRIVAETFHRRAGSAHAEALALKRAGRRARGATLYLTLEPCAHHGRTPPCAPLVAAAGLARVVVATVDPNPAVHGRGIAILRRAGTPVTLGVMRSEATALNRRFFVGIAGRRPYVTLKVAMTLDGRIATARGDSRWITEPAQRRSARALRGEHDGVLVGIGTVLADDPLLLPVPRVGRPFLRMVADTRLRIPTGSRLVGSARRHPLIVLCSKRAPAVRRRALEKRGVEVVSVRTRGGRVDLGAALRRLRSNGVVTVMVEGGGEILGSLLAARLFDEVVIYRGAILLGGRRSRAAFAGPSPSRLAGGVRLRPGPASLAPAQSELWYPARRHQ